MTTTNTTTTTMIHVSVPPRPNGIGWIHNHTQLSSIPQPDDAVTVHIGYGMTTTGMVIDSPIAASYRNLVGRRDSLATSFRIKTASGSYHDISYTLDHCWSCGSHNDVMRNGYHTPRHCPNPDGFVAVYELARKTMGVNLGR